MPNPIETRSLTILYGRVTKHLIVAAGQVLDKDIPKVNFSFEDEGEEFKNYIISAKRKKEKELGYLILHFPETYSHPIEQISLVRHIVSLVNEGFKIILITHSVYILKELNNCLMLSQEFEGKVDIMQSCNYTEDCILERESVIAYYVDKDNFIISKCDECGFEFNFLNTFNEEMSEYSDTITNAVLDQKVWGKEQQK